ncbi:hypothetical protein [Acidovorax anthurii]|uniref:hypothetical protein n=1 Tax=Paracidovorax anthurii TaxID=78229 RepID=UPI0011BECEEA
MHPGPRAPDSRQGRHDGAALAAGPKPCPLRFPTNEFHTVPFGRRWQQKTCHGLLPVVRSRRRMNMRETLTVVAGFVLFSSLGIAYLAASMMSGF